MGELEAEEAVGDGVEGDGVVLAQGGYESVQVVLVGGENKGVVNIYDNVGGFGRCGAIEEACVEC